jgi:hypothetical protein
VETGVVVNGRKAAEVEIHWVRIGEERRVVGVMRMTRLRFTVEKSSSG